VDRRSDERMTPNEPMPALREPRAGAGE